MELLSPGNAGGLPEKNFHVAIDFVGNFRKTPVAPLALAGFTSMEQYAEACRVDGRREIGELTSTGCYLNADTDVQRSRGREIRRIVKGDLSREERLKDAYIPFWRDETPRKLLRERVEL